MENKECKACRVCGAKELEPLFSLGNHLVNDFPLPADVGKGPRCPIEIVMCGRCGLVQQRWSAPQELLYRRHYHYRSGVTATMRAALKEVADKACALAGVKAGDAVLSVGSNDGTELRCYPDNLIRIGVEPAENLATGENYTKHDLLLVKDFWPLHPTALGNRKAKVVSALGMMYDSEDPRAFVRGVADVLAPGGVFVAQLMCLKQMVEQNDVGNLCHEHLEFYSLRCLLEHVLKPAGLRCFDLKENAVNGGSYRLWCCRADERRPDGQERPIPVERFLAVEDGMGLNDPTRLKGWWDGLEENRRMLLAFLKVNAGIGKKKIWALGASTKGNTILQWLDLPPGLVEAAADRAPEKVGRCTVTGVPIRSEEAFRVRQPDLALVLPYAFRAEIAEREDLWHKMGGRFVWPLPRFEVS